MFVQRKGALIGDEVIGAQPILTNDNRIFREAADLFYEPGEVERDLRIRWGVVTIGLCHRLGIAQLVYLDDPRNYRSL